MRSMIADTVLTGSIVSSKSSSSSNKLSRAAPSRITELAPGTMTIANAPPTTLSSLSMKSTIAFLIALISPAMKDWLAHAYSKNPGSADDSL
jgi:hypothetical protein